jgi:hypothetical protein
MLSSALIIYACHLEYLEEFIPSSYYTYKVIWDDSQKVIFGPRTLFNAMGLLF